MKIKWSSISFVISAILALLVFHYMPPIRVDAPVGTALGIFIMATILWVSEAIPIYITSFFIIAAESIFLAPLIEEISYKEFLHPFFSPTILLFIGGFALSHAMEHYHLDERIARSIISKVGEKPSIILLGMMASTAFLSMWMSNTATTALMISVIYPLIRQMEEDDPFRKALILGIPFSANIGGIGTPIGTPPNAIALNALKESGTSISFSKWIEATLAIELVGLLITWRLLLFVFPPKRKKLTLTLKVERLTITEIAVFLTLIITIILWLTSEFHGIPSPIISVFPVIVLFGTGLLKREAFSHLGWDVLILIGGGLSLGYAVHVSHLDTWFLNILGLTHVSPYIAFLVFALVAAILTNFMSNTSTAALLIPLALRMGANPQTLILGIALAASASMMLPISTPPNAIAYGSGYIQLKDMLKVGTIITVLMYLVIVSLGFTLWSLIKF